MQLPVRDKINMSSLTLKFPKEKKSTMETYWVPGVNHTAQYGRWAFAEFTEVYQIQADFKAKVESEFNQMIQQTVNLASSTSTDSTK